MEIRKSAEDYLEMMLMLQEKHGYIRSIDIAEELHVKKTQRILRDKEVTRKRLYYHGRG